MGGWLKAVPPPDVMPAEPIPEQVTEYLARGWPVAPVHVRVSEGKKVVNFLTDHGFKDATHDYDQVADWAVRWPDCGWTIPTGPDTFWALDLDGAEGLAELAKLGELPATHTIGTIRGGRHYYFAWTSSLDLRNSAGKLGDRLDVRGEGGCVFAPPTAGYEVLDEADPAPAPGWLVGLLTNSNRSDNITVPAGDAIPQGQRNNKLTSLAGAMRRAGFSLTSILMALHEHNAEQCRPPLLPGEVDRIAQSVARYDSVTPDSWIGQAIDLSGIRTPPEPPEELIGGFIESERLMLLFGAPGGFKSFLAMDQAVAIAAGQPWLKSPGELGLSTIQAPAVIIQQDQGRNDTEGRLHALYTAYDAPPDIPLYVYAFPRPGLNLIRNHSLLAEIIQHHRARFVVIDNLFNTAGVRDENSSEIGLAIRNLAEVRDATGAHILLVHHPAKVGGWSRGHGAILQNVDQSIKVVRDDDFVTFEQEKERGAGILSSLVARFEFKYYPQTRVMRSARFYRSSGDEYETKELGDLADSITSFIGDNPGTNKSQTAKAIGGDRSKIYRAIKMLINKEVLEIGPGEGRGDHLYLR